MNRGVPELIIIFFIIFVVFGAGRIPKIARDIGSGIREFRKAMNGEEDHPEPPKETKKISR